ncbi:MAG: hypothetical protein KA210_02880 [Bacteroidia bacterium]|nr:hypothetical protein [Bacteroidia bacterium]
MKNEKESLIVPKHILVIAQLASLEILIENDTVDIKHQFRFGDKSILGVLILLFGGLFLFFAPFIKDSDSNSKIVGVIIGLLLSIISILTLTRQVTGKLKITDNTITFRYNLKRTSIPLNSKMNVKMKTEIKKMSRAGTLGSEYIVITHYLQEQNKEIPILKFQLCNSDTDNAEKLGEEIIRLIKNKILKSINN